MRMRGVDESGKQNVRIISTTPTIITTRSGGTVGRMGRTIITSGILAIDVALFGED
jgi:hypothetical protein